MVEMQHTTVSSNKNRITFKHITGTWGVLHSLVQLAVLPVEFKGLELCKASLLVLLLGEDVDPTICVDALVSAAGCSCLVCEASFLVLLLGDDFQLAIGVDGVSNSPWEGMIHLLVILP